MKRLLIILLSCLATGLYAQDLSHYKRVIKQLSSAKYQGRGYAYDGANRAGEYLEREFRKAGVDDIVRQSFKIDINTFPGKMSFKVDGKPLKAGMDFTLREFSPGIKGEFPLYNIDTANYNSEQIFKDLEREEYKGALVVCDFEFSYKHSADFRRLQRQDGAPNSGVILTWKEPLLKFYKAYGERVAAKPNIWANSSFPHDGKRVELDIENKFYEDYECFNVIAKVEGERSDSCYIFTAHYDHLGNLGKRVYYAGAHDNASGTAAIVTLAAHYAKHKPKYDIYFIAFSGEDAFLRGSEWYVEHPIVPLSQIKYLINLDMIADNNPMQYCEVSDTGEVGFKLMEQINNRSSFIKGFDREKLEGNSDHYPFAQRGVPCIFLSNKDGDAFKYYHTILDTYKSAYYDGYEPLFKLIVEFIEQY